MAGKKLLQGFVLLHRTKALQWAPHRKVLLGHYVTLKGRILLNEKDEALELERMKRDKYSIKPAMITVEW